MQGVARIGDGHHHHDRTGSECFPCRWPEINDAVCDDYRKKGDFKRKA